MFRIQRKLIKPSCYWFLNGWVRDKKLLVGCHIQHCHELMTRDGMMGIQNILFHMPQCPLQQVLLLFQLLTCYASSVWSLFDSCSTTMQIPLSKHPLSQSLSLPMIGSMSQLLAPVALLHYNFYCILIISIISQFKFGFPIWQLAIRAISKFKFTLTEGMRINIPKAVSFGDFGGQIL